MFFTRGDREYYLECLREYSRQYGLHVMAYCLMTNHVHMVMIPAFAKGRLADLVHSFRPRVGDVIDNPAGTIHAVGDGVLFAEIQDAWPVTYRLYDWNRVDAQGRSRELHVEESMACMSWESTGPDRVKGSAQTLAGGTRTLLVANPSYELERWEVTSDLEVPADGRRFELLAVTGGRGRLEYEGGQMSLALGAALLVPAALGAYRLRAEDRLSVMRSLPVEAS